MTRNKAAAKTNAGGARGGGGSILLLLRLAVVSAARCRRHVAVGFPPSSSSLFLLPPPRGGRPSSSSSSSICGARHQPTASYLGASGGGLTSGKQRRRQRQRRKRLAVASSSGGVSKVADEPPAPADRNGFRPPPPRDDVDGRNDADGDGRPLFDGRKSPFGSAALGKKRRPPLQDSFERLDGGGGVGDEEVEAAQQQAQDDATASLLLRRDRALLALQQHLRLDTTSSLSVLTSHPDLYHPVKCPSLSSKLLYLLEVVNVPRQKLARMMLTKPALTTNVILECETTLAGTIEILQTELGLTSSDVLSISSGRLPAVLGYDRSDLRRKIRAYRDSLGYPPDVLKRMVLRNPEILRTDGGWVRGSARVLGEELDMELEDVHRMVKRANLVLTYDPEGNVRPTVRYLKEGTVGQCLGLVKKKGKSVPLAESPEEAEGIVRERVREFVVKFPHVLGLSVEKNLRPTLDFFLNEVGVDEEGLGKMLTRRPALLELKPDTMRGKLAFLKEELDVVDDAQLAEMAVRFPDVFSLSVEDNLRPKIAYFRGAELAEPNSSSNSDVVARGLGMNSTQIRHVFLSKPQIFSLNLNRNIRPKVEYLLRPVGAEGGGGAGLSPTEVRDWWASYPQTVMCSLDNLIKPRMELIQRAGLTFRPSAEADPEEKTDGDGADEDAKDQREGDGTKKKTKKKKNVTVVPINFVWKPKRNWEVWVRKNIGDIDAKVGEEEEERRGGEQ